MPKPNISNLRRAIEKLSKWESSGAAFGFIKTVSNKNPDYIYEFFCAMRVLKDLSVNHLVEITPGTNGFKFPRKPGNKSDWAYFEIKDKNTGRVLYQFCLGTTIKISSSPSTTFGADISIQKGHAGYDPDESDIVLIMDAKYKENNSSKLDIGTIREFAACVRDMNVPKGIRGRLVFNSLVRLRANCLFTNGEAETLHQQYCTNRKLKQVGRFDCDRRTMQIIG